MSELQIPEGAVFERVAIDAIEATAATQVRVRIDRAMVDQYAEDFENGAAFPPLTCFREPNSQRIILADGFHRHRAAINAGRKEIGCVIYPGGMHEALEFALGANAEHGFRRTNADKRHAVQMALKDPALSKLLAREIADVCRVTERMVHKIINENLSSDESDSQSPNGSADNSGKVKSNDGADVVPVAEITQEQVETDELIVALKSITCFPYPGEDAVGRLNLDADIVADAEYVSTWLAALVIEWRNRSAENANRD